MTQLIAYPKLIFIQDNQPTDFKKGMLWYDTLSSALYASDGTNYNLISNVDLSTIEKMISENSLNILQNTAQAGLSANTTANFLADVYTSAGGYLSSVDTANTTALFDTNSYSNSINEIQTYTQTTILTEVEGSFSTNFTMAKQNSYLSSFDCLEALTGGGNWTINIKNGTLTFASKTIDTINGWNTINFLASDYSALFQIGDILTLEVIANTGDPRFATQLSAIPAGIVQAGNYYLPNYYTGYNINFKTSYISDLIVKTLPQTISITPTVAMITANETIAGTGSVTYDLSTDGGLNFQTGLIEGDEITLTNVGSSLILKQNLNGVGAGNTATAKDWGVSIW